MPKGNTRPRPRKPGNIPARRDPEVQIRMDEHWALWAKRYTRQEIMRDWNSKAEARGFSPISIHTVTNDRNRILADRAGQGNEELRQQHLATLSFNLQQAIDAFTNAPAGSLNRSAYLNVITSTVKLMAQIDGTFKAMAAPGDNTGDKSRVTIQFVNQYQRKSEGELVLENEEFKKLTSGAEIIEAQPL